MKRPAAALALCLALGGTSGCADLTTTGLPQEGAQEVTAVSESLPPDVDPLAGTSWMLAASTSEAVDVAAFEITAEFTEGTLAGKAPVNRYNAMYEVPADGEIEIGPVGATKMAGPPEAMAAEGAYFALLERVTGFTATSTELQLIADGEPVLVYEPATNQAGASPDPATSQAQALADTLVGKEAAQAEASVVAAGLSYRVLAEDGVYNAVTSDYNPQRVNVEITDGTVTTASVG